MENNSDKGVEVTPIITITPTPSKSDHIPDPPPDRPPMSKKIVLLLVIIVGMSCILIWKRTQFATVSVSEAEPEPEQLSVLTEPDELFAEQDTMLEEGKRLAAMDTEIVNGMEILRDVISQLVQKSEDAGDAELASDRIIDAYSSYISAMYRHKDMLDGQALSGAIYKQIVVELEEAVSLGNSLTEKGYDIDASSVMADRDAFKSVYTDKLISAFDEFTGREMWSRTEAWNLMSETVDNMFESSDLDNPVRLRYAYALSWWVQKQIETELNSGTITAKGAAIKIANMIDIMDYSPMMIHAYISYMNEAGEDCAEVSNAYNDIVEHLFRTQGIRIGEDIDLAHFWYFNDFITHSVDDMNGVTQENRQWIRGRMSYVTFVEK